MKTVEIYLTVTDNKRVLLENFSECNAEENFFYLQYGGGMILIRNEKEQFQLRLAGMTHTLNAIFLKAIPFICRNETFSREFFEKTGYYITLESDDYRIIISEFRFVVNPVPPEMPLQQIVIAKSDFLIDIFHAITQYNNFSAKLENIDMSHLEKDIQDAKMAMHGIGVDV